MPPVPPQHEVAASAGHVPAWRAEHLGFPIPADAHAISVCLPTWQDVIDYEEGAARVREALQTGYPRFVLPPQLLALHDATAEREDGGVLAFSGLGAARRALAYVERGGCNGRVEERAGLGWLALPDAAARALAWQAWRYGGEGASGRAAEDALAGRVPFSPAGDVARQEVAVRLADWHGVAPEDVYLFPSGMAAVATIHRFLASMRPQAGTVQVDFPYVDVARVQKAFGSGQQVSMTGTTAVQGGLAAAFDGGFTAAVFAEVPANPLLDCADVPALARVCAARAVPMVVDDTVASVYNVQVLAHVDFVTTSLSKWFNGKCNLLAGAVVVNPRSPWAADFRAWARLAELSGLADRDALELAVNSRGFARRMQVVNRNGAQVAAYLRAHPAVRRVWYPDLAAGGNYAAVARAGAGTGGLMSFCLAGGEPAARKFYDALEMDKGPSLGAEFSLLCPYVLLAHYDELEYAAQWGAVRDLLRLSVGTEPADLLVATLGNALAAAGI